MDNLVPILILRFPIWYFREKFRLSQSHDVHMHQILGLFLTIQSPIGQSFKTQQNIEQNPTLFHFPLFSNSPKTKKTLQICI